MLDSVVYLLLCKMGKNWVGQQLVHVITQNFLHSQAIRKLRKVVHGRDSNLGLSNTSQKFYC